MGSVGEFFVELGGKLDSKGFDAFLGKVEDTKKKTLDMSGALKGLAGIVSIAAVTKFFVDVTTAAGEAEESISELNRALKTTGQYSADVSQAIRNTSTEIQKMTTADDETITSGQAMLISMGAQLDMLPKLTMAVLNLATAKKIDEKTAFDLVSKSIGSSTNALGRYGIEIEGVEKSSQRATMAIQNINAVFGGAAVAQADTYLGRIKMLQNRWNDISETIGNLVIPYVKELFMLIETNLLPNIEELLGSTKESDTAMENFGNGIKFATNVILGFVGAVKMAWAANNVLGYSMSFNFKQASLWWAELEKTTLKYGETITRVNNTELKERRKTNEEIKSDTTETIEFTTEEMVESFQKGQEEYKKYADIVWEIEQAIYAQKSALFLNTAKVFQSSFGDAFADVITNTKSVGDAFTQMYDNIKTAFLQLVGEIIAKQALLTAVSFLFPGAAVGGPGIGSYLLSAISKFDKGGVVPGPVGQPQLAVVHGGEEFSGAGKSLSKSMNINNTVHIGSITTENKDEILRKITEAIKDGNAEALRMSKNMYNHGRLLAGESA